MNLVRLYWCTASKVAAAMGAADCNFSFGFHNEYISFTVGDIRVSWCSAGKDAGAMVLLIVN